MGYGDHMGWMSLWWLLGIGLIALFVWVIARAATAAGPPRSDDAPEVVLKRRYARGEIEHDEYERRLHDLRQ